MVWRQKWLAMGLAAAMSLPAHPVYARSKGGLPLIRDAEIETLIRDYSLPIFKAAGVNARSVSIYIIDDRQFNAFVANGQRLFINAGALMESRTPNEIIGVIAHETGHIAGGHLARLRQQLERANSASIIAMLLGIGAMVAGARSGAKGAAGAGSAIISGGQSAIMRSLLAYQRTEEAAADRAALTYLNRTKQSAEGMIKTFQRFADQQLVSGRYIDPYIQSHPMARARIAQLQTLAQRSKYYDRKDPTKLQLRHDLMRAKLVGFLEHPTSVLRRYPNKDQSLPARYARAIARYRGASLKQALRDIDGLISSVPKYPYFWELKGQALLEASRPKEAVAPLRQAVALAPNAHLIRLLYGQALLSTGDTRYLDQAIQELNRALARESEASLGYRQLAIAYSRKGDVARASLNSARAYFLEGKYQLAKRQAARTQKLTKTGSPLWLQADDIIKFKPPARR